MVWLKVVRWARPEPYLCGLIRQFGVACVGLHHSFRRDSIELPRLALPFRPSHVIVGFVGMVH
jgi:hypothetical protein